MKKVCFLLHYLDPGGIETKLLRFLKFKREGIIPTVICKSGITGELYKDYLNLGVEVITIKSGYYNIKAWYKIYQVLKKGNFDSVCDLTSNFGGVYLFLARLANIKRRTSYYGQGSNHYPKSWLNDLYNSFVHKLVYYNATVIVLNSRSALEYYYGYRKKEDTRFRVVFNGVDTTVFKEEKEFDFRRSLGIPDNGFVIGHTGRLDEKKNQQAIINLAVALKEYGDIYFIICGMETELLNDRIQSLGLSDHFFAVGYRSDVHLVLRNFDIFYFPSYTEGQPNSLIEALISGLPIIASNISPIKETIPEKLWVQLVHPDDIEGAKIKVLELYNNRKHMAAINYRDWAMVSFDASLRFGEFYDCL